MQELRTLIDKASETCGSDSALARKMGIDQPSIAQMRSGRRTITPETAVEMAAIAGMDPLQAAAAAILERSKGTRREGVLREILGKALVTGVAAMWLFSYSDSAISGQVSTQKSETAVNKIIVGLLTSEVGKKTTRLFKMANLRVKCHCAT